MMEIKTGFILEGPFWKEKVRVISVKAIGADQVKIEAVGLTSNPPTFYNPILTKADLEKVTVITERAVKFTGDANRFFLFTEAQRIRNAFQFDPLYAVNVSQVDPLPHQIEAVYYYILQNPGIRFLLADDPGAGKTIMAGLLLKELKYRGLVERVLIIVPGHLKDQWLREMKERFQESFVSVDRGVLDAHWSENVWKERNQIITSLDFAKQDDVMFSLKDTRWDIVIVDEAHKMSAYKYGEKIDKTARYRFGELISSITNYLLFLTATPHRGDPENFRLFLELLEPGFFADVEMLSESIQSKDNPLFLRRLKEDLKDFENAPIFPPRKVETIKYRLSDDEKILYNAVTEYVEKHFNKALQKEKRNVAFAMVILQRRLASSVRAVRKSLERRRKRLQELYDKGQFLQGGLSYTEDYLEDLEERERWQKEEELLEKLTSAETLDELREEISVLDELIRLAREAEKKEIETKLNELKQLIDTENIRHTRTKLLIFTESRDTLEYLVEKLKKWGYPVTYIHGGMDLDARIRAEGEFKGPAQVMVATEAAGEGINLQFCWLMVNYDIPWNPNRLEQRMGRIHRYGQQHEVHIYNTVAVDTREGRILSRLFEKLDRMKEHMGSDRVFDVIGDILPGKSLKDLILDAIANKRTLDDILADFDRIPDEGAISKVKEASMEALATKHIDLTRILGEQRTAKENRLVPEYVEEFFKKAAKELNLKIEERQDGFWRIPSVPLEIRSQPHWFKTKFGEVLREYSKVSFDKEKAFKGQAEFVSMGHPLMEAVIETIFKRLTDDVENGAVFLDPEGKMDGLLWFLIAEIKDGNGTVAGRRLFSVYQDNQGNMRLVNPAILWDLKPIITGKTKDDISIDQDSITAFVIKEGLEYYKKELLERRERDAGLKQKYGVRSLESLILKSEEKLADYETRRIKGENIPEPTIQQEERKKEDLKRKKGKLLEQIRAETHLLPSEPKVIGVARVSPMMEVTRAKAMESDEEIEKIGMAVALDYERKNGREPEDVAVRNLGYDIRSLQKDGGYRYIEVKARAGDGAIALTPNEWLMAHRLKDEYWLYVAINAAKNPELFIIQNPVEHLRPDEEIDIVRFVVKNWKESSEKAK
jgi:superfamily II DNA or RNA helicase